MMGTEKVIILSWEKVLIDIYLSLKLKKYVDYHL